MELVQGRLLDTRPPLVNIEQAYDGFTHDPKGRAGEAEELNVELVS